ARPAQLFGCVQAFLNVCYPLAVPQPGLAASTPTWRISRRSHAWMNSTELVESSSAIGATASLRPATSAIGLEDLVPISRVFWSANSARDIHVLRGQSTRDLTIGDLVF